MESAFILKLLLSFVVGGSYIAFTIWVSEKFGSRIGGLLIGLPSTLLISLLFIAWTQDAAAAVSAVPVVPAAVAACSLFVVGFIFSLTFGRWIALFVSSGLWFALTLPLTLLSIKNIYVSTIIAALFFGIAIIYLNKFPHRRLEKFTLTRSEMLFRVFLTGSVVTFSVLMGKLLGPLWGGMFASFPAAFSSSLVLLERKHGIDFVSSVARAMPYGGMGNVLFAIMFFFLVPTIGIFAGTAVAYASALAFGLAVSGLMLKLDR